jgi:phosphoenolpyruvate synthase/pyruvate phosphate dikinase
MKGYIVRNPKLAWREVDGEMVIISPEDSQVHELNETASLIWKHAGGESLEEMAERISAEYEISLEAARADIGELVAALEQKQLVFVAMEAKV